MKKSNFIQIFFCLFKLSSMQSETKNCLSIKSNKSFVSVKTKIKNAFSMKMWLIQPFYPLECLSFHWINIDEYWRVASQNLYSPEADIKKKKILCIHKVGYVLYILSQYTGKKKIKIDSCQYCTNCTYIVTNPTAYKP
jgi:hypothetical protein